ncbi:DEAD/DEAH box helicase [Demequina iriomotensis]|uniref:DEAD/DEAH box helicase n=1 Tax=Demequina iriomotensis TaxID=1536641 RepID=UPI000783D248|nr:DEAD/DEAH box helicase [Demequina iriomotensis]
MGLRDIIRSVLQQDESVEPGIGFQVSTDSDGINVVTGPDQFERIDRGEGSPLATAQLILMRMLVEQGLADEIPRGFQIDAVHAAALDGEAAALLDLPPRYAGRVTTTITGHTASTRFAVAASGEVDGVSGRIRLSGPTMRIAGADFLASPVELAALRAIDAHAELAEADRTETANAMLVASLQRAAAEGMDIDLAHFTRGGWTTSVPGEVGISAAQTADGGLVLSPALAGLRVDEAESRWHQVSGRSSGVLRVGKGLIVLEERSMTAVHEVLRNRTIAPEEVEAFLRTPSAFLDAALVNLELGFSVRVEGIGRIEHMDFGDGTASNLDWFASDSLPKLPQVLVDLLKTPDDVARFERQLEAAKVQGADAVRFDAELIDIGDPAAVTAALEKARDRIVNGAPDDAPVAKRALAPEPTEKVGFLLREADRVETGLPDRAREASLPHSPDYSGLLRQPFPHQREGIEWMLRLMSASRTEDRDQLYRLQGALLADDMGLGKTYMTLVAISEVARAVENAGTAAKPALVVAPLSLIENWEDEVSKTFASSPFTEIVALQSGRDLRRFRRSGSGRETAQAVTAIDAGGRVKDGELRISLKVGADARAERLDKPGRLVLATYETLRDYQFSLSQIDWGVVVFDEAQALKNPDSMRTRAAKAMKADFKLLATGTPVENSLGEFWCLVDTAQPGLLGDWSDFRERYIVPAQEAEGVEADAVRARLGRELREAVGPFMLRREKEDHLEGLPPKYLHTALAAPAGARVINDPTLARTMPPAQRDAYEAHLHRLRSATGEGGTAALAVLLALRLASLHPELGAHGARPSIPTDARDAERQWRASAKLAVTMDVLRDIQARGEKVIVFAMSKDLQLLLALWLKFELGVRPHVINGDTAASSGGRSQSRKELIADFEAREGFNVIIMSPIAAGVGLTVVGANHVIHLERHWNPAKEAQATDRVYRIGQTRDVHVHLPAATHPDLDSFDVLLDRLLASKVLVRDAVMAPGVVSEAEMFAAFGGR